MSAEINKYDVLKKRAKLLSQPLQEEQLSQSFLELVVFKLAHENYALETRHTLEVYPLKDYTSLPGTPAYIFGLVNLRRKIITVVDLRPLFSLPVTLPPNPKIVIVGDREKEFAILTDGIIGIQKVGNDQIQAGIPTLTGIRQEFLHSLTKNGIVILDGAKLLSSRHLIVDEAVEV